VSPTLRRRLGATLVALATLAAGGTYAVESAMADVGTPPAPIYGLDTASTPSAGLGENDNCPSANQMKSLKDATPLNARAGQAYSAVGVYLPVGLKNTDDRHDKVQSCLTPTWIATVRSLGWSIIPIYLGMQAPAPCGGSGFWRMNRDPGSAYAQGKAAAADAAAQLVKLGMTGRTPVYYDMENYASGCADAVQAFAQGWSAGLRAKGDLSGFYGSRNSVAADLESLRKVMPACAVPDALWTAVDIGLNDAAPTTAANIPGVAGWTAHQRIVQYRSGTSAKIGVDADIVDGPVVPPTVAGTPTSAHPSPAPIANPSYAPPLFASSSCAPGPAVGVQAVPGHRAATVTWGAADAAGSAVTGYQVTNVTTGQTTTVGAGTLGHTFTGLQNGTRYTFRVVAINRLGSSIGNSAGAVPVKGGTTVDRPGVAKPGKPGKPRLTPKRGKLVVRWKKPADNGSRITRFRVYVNGKLHTVAGRKTSLTVSRLKRGSYRVYVQAVNAGGISAKSKVARARVH
jgi:hypothetical protein